MTAMPPFTGAPRTAHIVGSPNYRPRVAASSSKYSRARFI